MTARMLKNQRARGRRQQARQARRRTRHGLVCVCGSVNVVIDTSRRRDCPDENGDRVFLRKQGCRCLKCKRIWWRRVRVIEREL